MKNFIVFFRTDSLFFYKAYSKEELVAVSNPVMAASGVALTRIQAIIVSVECMFFAKKATKTFLKFSVKVTESLVSTCAPDSS